MSAASFPERDLLELAHGDPSCPVVKVFGGRPFHTDGEVLALAFDKSGVLWSLEEPGVLRGWDLEAGRQTSWRHIDVAAMLWCFSGDGKYLAGASDELSLWDVASADSVWILPQPSWVTAIALSPDNSLVATGHDDGHVRLWTTVDRDLVHDLAAHERPVSSLAFSPDGQRLASAGEEKVIHFWNVASGQKTGSLEGHTDRIPALLWHPDGQRFFSAGWDTTVRVWNATTCEPIILLNSHETQVLSLAISPDGQRLGCADSGQAVHLWRLSDIKNLWVIREHEAEVRCLAFSPDGHRLASGGADRILRVFDSRLPEPSWQATVPQIANEGAIPLSHLGLTSEPRTGLALSPDSRRLATTAGKALRIWDAASGQMVGQVESSQKLLSAAFSPDGQKILGGTLGGVINVWETGTGRSCPDLEGQAVPITALVCASRSPIPEAANLVASGSNRGQDVWVWDPDSGEPVLLIPDAVDGCAVEGLAFHPEGKYLAVAGVDWLATGGSDGNLMIWDVVGRHPVATLALGCQAVAFHPSGDLVALASLISTIRIYNWKTREVVHDIQGHEDLVSCVAFSPDGRWLASGGQDRTVRLWEATTGLPAGGIGLDTQVTGLTFSADSRTLFTGNANASSYLIEVNRLRRQ